MTPDEIAAIREIVTAEIARLEARLIGISRTLYENPEVSLEEHRSMALLADIALEAGFQVERGVGGLETSYKAVQVGAGAGPTVAFLAEYDALPELGHACGHNFIAAASTGAEFKGTQTQHYAVMQPNRTMADVFAAELERLGVTVYEPDLNQRMGSTDAGNLSQVVPSIHATTAMAMTAVELLARPELAAQVRQEFDRMPRTWRKGMIQK